MNLGKKLKRDKAKVVGWMPDLSSTERGTRTAVDGMLVWGVELARCPCSSLLQSTWVMLISLPTDFIFTNPILFLKIQISLSQFNRKYFCALLKWAGDLVFGSKLYYAHLRKCQGPLNLRNIIGKWCNAVGLPRALGGRLLSFPLCGFILSQMWFCSHTGRLCLWVGIK